MSTGFAPTPLDVGNGISFAIVASVYTYLVYSASQPSNSASATTGYSFAIIGFIIIGFAVLSNISTSLEPIHKYSNGAAIIICLGLGIYYVVVAAQGTNVASNGTLAAFTSLIMIIAAINLAYTFKTTTFKLPDNIYKLGQAI